MKGLGVGVTPIGAGLRTDFEKLLHRFAEGKSLRFARFADAFRLLQFGCIFAGRSNELELREVHEKSLSLALTYCVPPLATETLQRVGGIYLLYSLFYLQNSHFRMHIRATANQIRELRTFMAEVLHPEGHLDTLFTLHRLFMDQAFHLCAYADEHNPLRWRQYDNAVDTEGAADSLRPAEENHLETLLADPVTQQVSVIHQKYDEMKKLMCAGFVPQSLQLMSHSLTDQLHEIAQDYQTKVDKRYAYMNKDKDKDVKATPKKKPKSPVKERRAELRKKAYSGVAVQARHRRHRQQRGDGGDDDDAHLPLEASPLARIHQAGAAEGDAQAEVDAEDVADAVEVEQTAEEKKRERRRKLRKPLPPDAGQPAPRAPGRPRKHPHKEPKDAAASGQSARAKSKPQKPSAPQKKRKAAAAAAADEAEAAPSTSAAAAGPADAAEAAAVKRRRVGRPRLGAAASKGAAAATSKTTAAASSTRSKRMRSLSTAMTTDELIESAERTYERILKMGESPTKAKKGRKRKS